MRLSDLKFVKDNFYIWNFCFVGNTQETQDVNWRYIRLSEDVLDIFWTSYVGSIYALCLQDNKSLCDLFLTSSKKWSKIIFIIMQLMLSIVS